MTPRRCGDLACATSSGSAPGRMKQRQSWCTKRRAIWNSHRLSSNSDTATQLAMASLWTSSLPRPTGWAHCKCKTKLVKTSNAYRNCWTTWPETSEPSYYLARMRLTKLWRCGCWSSPNSTLAGASLPDRILATLLCCRRLQTQSVRSCKRL